MRVSRPDEMLLIRPLAEEFHRESRYGHIPFSERKFKRHFLRRADFHRVGFDRPVRHGGAGVAYALDFRDCPAEDGRNAATPGIQNLWRKLRLEGWIMTRSLSDRRAVPCRWLALGVRNRKGWVECTVTVIRNSTGAFGTAQRRRLFGQRKAPRGWGAVFLAALLSVLPATAAERTQVPFIDEPGSASTAGGPVSFGALSASSVMNGSCRHCLPAGLLVLHQVFLHQVELEIER